MAVNEPIEAIIWDNGGVFLRTEDVKPRTALAARFGITYDRLNKIVFESETSQLAELGEISRDEHWQSVAGQLGVAVNEIKLIEDTFFSADRFDYELLEFAHLFCILRMSPVKEQCKPFHRNEPRGTPAIFCYPGIWHLQWQSE